MKAEVMLAGNVVGKWEMEIGMQALDDTWGECSKIGAIRSSFPSPEGVVHSMHITYHTYSIQQQDTTVDTPSRYGDQWIAYDEYQ